MDDDLTSSERERLLARIEQQAEALAELRRALTAQRVRDHRHSEELREAQIALGSCHGSGGAVAPLIPGHGAAHAAAVLALPLAA